VTFTIALLLLSILPAFAAAPFQPGQPLKISAIDLSPIEPTQWAIASRWQPTGTDTDTPDIPDFLIRWPTDAILAEAAE
jgi:hypothetical protein